jgi:hypothetical protein
VWLIYFSLKGDAEYRYEGDRTREDIVAFAQRLMGPPVRTIASVDEMKRTLQQTEIVFAFVGEMQGTLWVGDLCANIDDKTFTYVRCSLHWMVGGRSSYLKRGER